MNRSLRSIRHYAGDVDAGEHELPAAKNDVIDGVTQCEDAARIATRSVVVADGRIAWQGKTNELLSGKGECFSTIGDYGLVCTVGCGVNALSTYG